MTMSNSTASSPKSPLPKMVLSPKPKPFKVMVLGQSGVGKSALVVRFITRRFIGEYDSNLEKVYGYLTGIDNETVYFDILDSAGDSHEREYSNLESNIRWAEAFVLMYSVTDKCSFDECQRIKFLINYNKRRRLLANPTKDAALETPVILVGNKIDQVGDRMISTEEGRRRSQDIGCVCFHEISVRESIDQVRSVFRDARRFWRVGSVRSRWARRGDAADCAFPDTLCRRWTEEQLEEEPSEALCAGGPGGAGGFRARAGTDPRPARTAHARRLSVAMRGHRDDSY